MTHALLVGFGGFVGSIVRYWIAGFAQRWWNDAFPFGTLVVNLLGCFVIGVVMYLVEHREFFTAETRIFVTVGVLGGFTTFSTFGYETFALLGDHKLLLATLNVFASVGVGVGAVAGGWMAAKLIGI
jgi:fluoride exporter